MVRSHSAALAGLTDATLYHYSVRSRDAAVAYLQLRLTHDGVKDAMRTAIEAQQRQYGLPETAEREKSIPIGRVSVPDDVARAAAFLASDESSYMTGESINLSGGLLMD